MDRGTEGDANTLPAASCSQGDWLLSFIHDPEGPRSGCVASCGVPTQGQSALPSLAYYTLTGRDQTSKRHPNLCHSAPHPRMGGPLDIKGSEPVGASSENQPRTALPPLSLSLSPSIYLSLFPPFQGQEPYLLLLSSLGYTQGPGPPQQLHPHVNSVVETGARRGRGSLLPGI